MKHPWQLYDGWQDGAAYYNVTQGTPEWDYYVSTLVAFYDNSFKVPSFAGFAILALFGLVVLVATARNVVLTLAGRRGLPSSHRFVDAFQNHVSRAPLFKHRHATVYRLAGDVVTLQAPLRGETVLLVGLLLANVVPLVAFYTPYTAHNLYWPDNVFVEVGRYLSDRAGILATAQLPPLILLSGRSNPVSLVTGASFATCMLYHRWIARLVMLQILVHAIGYSVISVRDGGVAEFKALYADPYMKWGAAATVLFAFLCFFSIRWFRAAAYEWFVIAHVVSAVLAIVATFYHIELLNTDGSYADFVNYIYASLFFYLFEKAVRVVRVLYLNGLYHRSSGFCSSTGTVTVLPPTSDTLAISVRLQGHGVERWMRDTAQLRAGLNVQLWIPRCQPLSSHPFTVASMHTDDEGSVQMQLYARVHRGITARLLSEVEAGGGQCKLSMLVEGFYGHQTQLSLARGQILVAGGIGITHCLSYLQEALAKGTEAHLIWLMRDPALIATVLDVLKRTAAATHDGGGGGDDNEEVAKRKQRLSIYITKPIFSPSLGSDEGEKADNDDEGVVATLRKDSSTADVEESRSDHCSTRTNLLERVKTVHPTLLVDVHLLEERPDLHEIVRQAAACSQVKGTAKTALLCCGPAGMLDCLRSASRQLQLDYQEEAFQW